MNNTLAEVWHEVEQLLEQGFNVIPIRDKDDDFGPEKSPYKAWTKYQSVRITKEELWEQMEEKNTTAIAIVCGKISRNLFVIDIDSKHKPGIDALVFADIKNFYPELWERLRIHQSRNKGYHIPVFLDGQVPASQKIAGRLNTTEENEIWAAKKNKPVKNAPKSTYFIETRGEGGLISWPPSSGYKVVKDLPVPILTGSEVQQLVNICYSYHEIIEVEKPYKPTKYDDTWYETNPFEDYNQRCDAIQLMEDNGWIKHKSNSRFATFRKPAGRKGDVHAGFDFHKRLIRFFTTESEFDTEKSYNPATVLSVLQFAGDKKKTYAYLVDKGYGKVRQKIEQQQIKRKVLNGEPLPANFSPEAKQQAVTLTATLKEQHPYGIFWEWDGEKYVISRERLYAVASELGFRLHKGDIVRIIGQFIHSCNERCFFDVLKEYIHDEDADTYEDICNTYESFIQHNGKFTISRLLILDTDLLLTDTRERCNKFYQNGFLSITQDTIEFHPYSDLTQLIFHSRIQPRSYHSHQGGKYVEYLDLAIGVSDYLRKIIGFLTHEYKDETMAYFIILTEQCKDPKDGGGSGKNVFGSLLSHSTTYISKPGSQSKFDEKFFQVWKGQKIFCISDLPDKFDFAFFKDMAGGSLIWKKLWVDEQVIDSGDAPKLLFNTNFSYEVSDGGLRRRIIPVEFTNFFTLCGGIDIHFRGCHFPNGWTDIDWNGYDTFIAECIQLWLRSGLKLSATDLSPTGWEKQFIHTYKQTAYDIIKSKWEKWLDKGFVSNEDFKRDVHEFYVENSTPDRYKISPQKLNEALEAWAKNEGGNFYKDYAKWVNAITVKGKFFEPQKAPF